MIQLLKYFHRKRIKIKRSYISSKLDYEIRKTQEILESRYKTKYKKRGTITYQSASEAVADRIKELRQNGEW